MLRFGPETGPVVMVALPLFEEANRVRALAVSVCRALADRGVASVLPDLPGQGESLVPLQDCTLSDMQDGFHTVCEVMRTTGRLPFCVSIRSGALLAPPAMPHWCLAPQDTTDLLRHLRRIQQAGNLHRVPETTGPIAGNPISAAFLGELAAPETAPAPVTRTLRLNGDPAEADRHVAGNPLWRRAEPDNDAALAQVLAADIAAWIASCAG